MWTGYDDPEEDFVVKPREDEEDASFANTLLTVFIHLIFAWQMKFCVSDNSVDSLLGIVGYLLTMLQCIFGLDELCQLAENFPNTKHKARKTLGFDTDEFLKFVVCPKCHKLFSYEQAVVTVNGKQQSNVCTFVLFPNHPQLRFREPCGESLMKAMISADGKKQVLYPRKVYCYQSLKLSLQRLIDRAEIRVALMDQKQTHGDDYFDVYDGKVWQSMTDINGNLYTEDWRNLLAMFNIDWFQPFDKSEHSVGALYMVLLNLPREIRFKKENVLLIGLIPGPKEPVRDVNSYLTPLVNELLSFWKGVYLNTNGDATLYRLALCCIASDLPATRKCCGFLTYSADKGNECFSSLIQCYLPGLFDK